MSWKSKITAALTSTAGVVANSVSFIKGQFGVTVTDEQVDLGVKTAHDVAQKLEAILVDYIGDIPGVPDIVAKLGAELALKAVDAAIAGAGEAIKARN